ncbi:hypothetical protein [uncultured Pseudoflavonifractor sp.]|uniref:hypothetical protein n=1 Tax=uncultured Pseudoflavonifractor sp. TaxID=1221379 RepID=UPI0025F9EAB3|nr:hypothetical protein [uncultured Pseudoflavonifractor sp.]
MEDAINYKSIFRNESSTPDVDAYTRIWLELVKRAAEQELYQKAQAADGNR